MLTNNLAKAFCAYSKNASISSVNYNAVNYQGNTVSVNCGILGVNFANKFSAARATSGNNNSCFMLGTGDTPASVNDYSLAATIEESKFTRSTASVSIQSNGALLFTQAFIWNDVETEIKEVGIMFEWQGHDSVLIAREVLDSPITVNNGDTFTVSMTIG